MQDFAAKDIKTANGKRSSMYNVGVVIMCVAVKSLENHHHAIADAEAVQ